MPENSLEKIENLRSQFLDLATEVIVKEDLLCEGIQSGPFTDEIIGIPWASLRVSGGPYNLLPTIVRPPVRPDSPYALEADSTGQIELKRNGEVLAAVRRYPLTPRYVDRTFGGDLSFGDVVWPDGKVHPVRLVDDGAFTRSSSAGDEKFDALNPRALAQAVFDAYAMEYWPFEEGPLRIELDAGRLPAVYEGTPEETFFEAYVEAIASRLHSSYHVLLDMSPKPMEIERRLYRTGVTVRSVALGVWDPQVFEASYSELNSVMPYSERIANALDLIDVYGGGAVLVDFDIGAEATGGRFANLTDALASTRAGFKFCCNHGCLPRLFHAPESTLDVEYFLEADRAFYEVWVPSGASEPHTYIMGVGRNRFPYSAAWDVGRGGPPEFASEWDADLLGAPGFRAITPVSSES